MKMGSLTLALALAVGIAGNAAAEENTPAKSLPLKITEERYNPGICKPAIQEYYKKVKDAAYRFDAEKMVRPEIQHTNPQQYENALRDGDIIHMGAFGIDRFANAETADKWNKQNAVVPGTAEDRQAGETIFCSNLFGYATVLGEAISFQIPVKQPSDEELADSKPDATAPTRISFERFNVAACPAPILGNFREMTHHMEIPNPQMPDNHAMPPDVKAAMMGAQFRIGMIRAAQAGLVYAASDYALYIAEKDKLDLEQTHGEFCGTVKAYTESLEYFIQKHFFYLDPKKAMPPKGLEQGDQEAKFSSPEFFLNRAPG
ncbi:MAG TPA: hypothetical protein VIG74_01260 [Alphaproteobacteria bacterium]